MAFPVRPTTRHFTRAAASAADAQRPIPEPAPFMTPEDVARVLRTSRAAVYKMQERGQLPGVRRIGQNPTSSLNGVQ